MKKLKKIYILLYIIMIVLSVFMVLSSILSFKGESQTERLEKEYLSLKDGWVDAVGKTVDLENLNLVEGADKGEYVSIFYQMPNDLKGKNTLYIFSRHLYIQVWIDGRLLYEPYYPENCFFLQSSGHYRNFIVLDEDISRKKLEIRYMCPYENARCCITDLYIGSGPGMAMNIISSGSVAFVTSILLLFVGAIFVLADIPNHLVNKKNHELLYLGLTAIMIAIWCLAETHLLQMFSGNAKTLHLISCLSLNMISIPILLYVDEAFGENKRYIFSLICTLSALQFIVCIPLNTMAVLDMKETLFVTHIIIVMTFVYITYRILRFLIQNHKKEERFFYMLRIVGLGVFCTTALIDLYRFYHLIGADCAMFVRIGLLIFVVCYGVAGLEQTILAIQRGAKMELIRQLAYQDGLTGLGNRTAFKEHLDLLEKQNTTFGIIIFDVNNLKVVNDTFGHPIGDEFIRKGAKQINQAFDSASAKKFRIGGDEFAVIVENKNRAWMEECLEKFEQLIQSVNENEELPFKLSIAQGIALSAELKSASVEEVYRMADERMYENKNMMKEKKESC